MSDSIHPDILQRIIRQHPQVAEAIHVVAAVTTKAKFPIPSYRDLVDSLGGAEATLPLNGRHLSLAELEPLVPSYYFPIANENDLIAKLGDLGKRLPASAAIDASHEQGPNINAVMLAAVAELPHAPAPMMTLDDMHRQAGTSRKAAPGVGGISL